MEGEGQHLPQTKSGSCREKEGGTNLVSLKSWLGVEAVELGLEPKISLGLGCMKWFGRGEAAGRSSRVVERGR